MKRILSATLACILLLLPCLSLVSCTTAEELVNPIDFGKKYYLKGDEKKYYVFNEDHTGYFECYHQYVNGIDTKYDYTLSGRVEFEWREDSNGAVHLFAGKAEYREDHTEGETIKLTPTPISFSEEFFSYYTDNQYGGYRKGCVRIYPPQRLLHPVKDRN